jgi:hypothetical protein
MNRIWYKTLSALLWLAPVAICIRYRQLWDQLPAQMATHFDAAGRANGWMTREMSLCWSAGFLALMAAIFFVVLFIVQKKYELTKLSWTLLAFFHVEIWTLAFLLNSTLEFNLSRTPIAVAPFAIVSVVGAIVVAGVAIGEKRGKPLMPSEVIAQEVHSGKRFAALFLIAILFLIPVALKVPNPATRLATSVISVLIFAAFAMAWDGFHYYFTRHGVEIRTLGFRLRSIPLLQIKNYEVENWNPVRGYGIRGVGNRKAYVWGNNGVRVDLFDGSVFLGHGDPQRILHDLNTIKQFHHS